MQRVPYPIYFILSIGLLLLLIAPFAPVFESIFNENSNNWIHFKDILLYKYFINTSKLSFWVLLISIIIGVLPAYFISYYNFIGRGLFKILFYLPLAIPSYIMAYTYGDLFSFTGDFYRILSFIGIDRSEAYFNFLEEHFLILILAFSLFPYVYISSVSYFSSIPNNLISSAKSLGKSNCSIFFQIIIPISVPALSAGSFLILMEILNDYGAVKYFGYNTLTMGIFRAWLGMGDLSIALKISFYFIMFISVLLFINNYFNRRNKFIQSGNYERLKRQSISIGKQLPIILLLSSFLLFSLIIPISKITYNFIISDNFSDFFPYLLNSITLGVIGSLLIISLSILINYNNILNEGKYSNLINQISNIGYSIPGAIIAVGSISVLAYFGYNLLSLTLLIFALFVRFFGVGNSQLNSGFVSKGKIYLNSALSLNKSPLNVLINIKLPVLRKYLNAGFIICFVDIVKELPLTLILRPFNFDTLATRTYDYASDEMLLEASSPALIIVLIALIPLLLLRDK